MVIGWCDIAAAGERFKGLYLDAESVDNYHRGWCVFSLEIDIEDTMSVNTRYSGGAFMTYSLIPMTRMKQGR